MIKVFRVYILSLLLFLMAGPVFASQTDKAAKIWLERMTTALKTLNYEGVFVYIHGKQMETMRIFHSQENGIEKERLVSLAGAAREIIRNNDSLICILPDSKSVVVEKSRPKNYLPVGLQRVTRDLSKYYHFHVLGNDRMTGRDAVVIEVSPKDAYRYGYHLWIDKKTGMLLKSDLVDEKGDAIEQIMFTQLTILKSIPASRLEATIDSSGYKLFRQKSDMASDLKQNTSGKAWKVIRLPAGYMKGMQVKHGLPTSHKAVEHLMYTDGISSVSVYIEKMTRSSRMMKGFSKIGAVNAYTTAIAGYFVTVVGEVPRAAVKLIGDHVRYQP